MSDYMSDWARATLNPANQEKFFAEQERIRQDCERIEEWFYRTEQAMGLTDDQIAFLRQHEIVISTAYIGMVRLYIGNRTIFQTSAMSSIVNALFDGPVTDYEGLSSQVREYLGLLMSATPDVQAQLLCNNMPLFGDGELDGIRALCEIKKGSR